jgi:hypothetical protein
MKTPGKDRGELRATHITDQPCSANASAAARPNPFDAQVITITWPRHPSNHFHNVSAVAVMWSYYRLPNLIWVFFVLFMRIFVFERQVHSWLALI